MSMSDCEPYQLLLSVIVTEKTTQQKNQHNKYTFKVPVAATKTDIADVVFKSFGVRPVSVDTQRYKEVARRYKFSRGYSKEWKKAIVTISKQETLPL